MKQLPRSARTGELGTNLIQRIVLEMDCMWHPTGATEAGIDGSIEIVDPATNEATNQIITVQSKATSDFAAEGPDFVEYTCKERDLTYWLQGNTPVILVYSKPRSGEAYWVSVKHYFSDPRVRAARKIRFDKRKDVFNQDARSALERLAVPRNAGLYLGLPPRDEDLHSDLVPVRAFPPKYWTAPTELASRREITERLRKVRSDHPRAWVFHGKSIFSFEPLAESVWDGICERGAIDEDDTNDWSRTQILSSKRVFVELLNATLRDQLFVQDILYNDGNDYFYEKPAGDLLSKRTTYSSRTRRATRTTFKAYTSLVDGKSLTYCRHAAFTGSFLRFGHQWYLQISPTYHFTSNGYNPTPLAQFARSGIKRLEKNQAVHGQVLMWARRLQQQASPSSRKRKLFFAEPLKFVSHAGFDEASWPLNDESQLSNLGDFGPPGSAL